MVQETAKQMHPDSKKFLYQANLDFLHMSMYLTTRGGGGKYSTRDREMADGEVDNKKMGALRDE